MKLIKKFSLSFASLAIKTEYIELKRTYVQGFFMVKQLFSPVLTFSLASCSCAAINKPLLFHNLPYRKPICLFGDTFWFIHSSSLTMEIQ